MTATLEVRKLEPGTSEHQRAVAMANIPERDLTKDSFPPARPMRTWLDHWGGYRGTLKAPDGSQHDVSLEPWRGEDPDSTFISIVVKYRDPSLIGRKGSRA